MYSSHFRIRNKNHDKLVKYQKLYRLKYHKNITQAYIINSLIANKIHNVKFSQKQLDNFNNRFNDSYYKKLLLIYLKFTNEINKLNQILAGGFNNINQIAKKLNQATDQNKLDDDLLAIEAKNKNSYNFKDIDLAYRYLKHIKKKGDKAWQNIM